MIFGIHGRFPSGFRGWLSPLVFLSNNWVSLLGVVVVTSAVVFWLFLLPATFGGAATHPYIGLLSFLLVPAFFFFGLLLIPLGIYVEARRRRRAGLYPQAFPPLDFRVHEFRRLAAFVGVTTFANIVLGAVFTYGAVTYMDTPTFCGLTCHTVMQPEYTAYRVSPHSRVECAACHIGSGASWFVRSKLSGVGQVFAVALNNYPRPIPTPVRNLRPARETCETCHWPQRFTGDRLLVVPKFADDEANTLTETVLLLHIGGGRGRVGIHGAHLAPGEVIEYAPADETRQTIPWVRRTIGGQSTTYLAADTKPAAVQNLPRRVMDCMDCHNRPTHTFQLPEPAVDQAMAAGQMSRSLPYMKKTSMQALRKIYNSRAEGEKAIAATLDNFYRTNYPALYAQKRADVARSSQAAVAIFDANVFPQMRVNWGTYPNNIGHMDFPGCFRCHDGTHVSAGGQAIPNDCETCHHMLAMDEASPKILTDLGMTAASTGR